MCHSKMGDSISASLVLKRVPDGRHRHRLGESVEVDGHRLVLPPVTKLAVLQRQRVHLRRGLVVPRRDSHTNDVRIPGGRGGGRGDSKARRG